MVKPSPRTIDFVAISTDENVNDLASGVAIGPPPVHRLAAFIGFL